MPDGREVAAALDAARTRLPQALRRRVRDAQQAADELNARLRSAACRQVERGRSRLDGLAGELHALSPLAVLGRGYSLTTGPDGVVLTDAAAVGIGDAVETRLASGRLRCEVLSVQEDRR